jgi:hypothetical protein
MTADRQLVDDELRRLAAVRPGDDGFERAFVRRMCLHRLGTEHAAAVLRQEALFALNPAGGTPWHGHQAPYAAWYTERNRMHFLADQADLVDYRLPGEAEIRQAVHARRRSRRVTEWVP